MALFKSKDSGATATMSAPTRAGAADPVIGADAAECMRVGQILVEREQLTPDNLATCLQQANGRRLNGTTLRKVQSQGTLILSRSRNWSDYKIVGGSSAHVSPSRRRRVLIS